MKNLIYRALWAKKTRILFLLAAAMVNVSTVFANITCAEAIAKIDANDKNEWTVEGFVTEIIEQANPVYGNITFWMADAADGGQVFEVYRLKYDSKDADRIPVLSDKVAVTATLKKYTPSGKDPIYETDKIKSYAIVAKGTGERYTAEDLVIEPISVAQAVEIATALDDVEEGARINTKKFYEVTGYVVEITTAYSAGQMTFNMADEASAMSGNLQAYHAIVNAEKGDQVKVSGALSKYKHNGTYIFSVEKGAAEVVKKGGYDVSTFPNDASAGGTVQGGGENIRQTTLTLIAEPFYGYHFVQWTDGNTDNPRVVEVTQDSSFTAVFALNPVITYLYNQTMGHVVGDTTLASEPIGEVTFEAIPNSGHHFVQWSDGNTNNPRTITLIKDTTFTAEFAIDKNGKCGDNLALTWSYDATNKVLTISGEGTLNGNYTFGIEAPTNAEKLIIAEGVTSIGNSAFAGYSTLKHLSVAASVKTIYEQAFYNCTGLQEIYSYRATPSTAYSNTFDGIEKFGCILHVMSASVDMYKAATGWRDFYYVQTIDAEEVSVSLTQVEIAPQENNAVVTWPTSEEASTYILEITKDDVVFCTLIFNANGQLTGIAFAPGKNGNHHAPAAVKTSNGGLRFTVTGLNSGTNYHLTLKAKDSGNQEIASYAADFTTTGTATGIDDEQSDNVQCTKVIRDGQLFILRGDKTYTVTGQEVK